MTTGEFTMKAGRGSTTTEETHGVRKVRDLELHREERKGAKAFMVFLGVLRGLAVRILTVERRNRDLANTLEETNRWSQPAS
jgi:hypothetical protein